MSYEAWLTEERPGVLRFGGARMALLDIEAGFWALRQQLEALAGPRLADSVLQQAGANGGASFARAFASADPAVDGERALRDCVAAYQAAGFGRFHIEEVEWPIGRVLIRADDTFEAWMARQHKQSPPSAVCAYTAGVLVGFVNALAERRDIVCIERACQALGAEHCRFELLPASAAGDVPLVAMDPDPALGRQINLLELLFDRMPMGIAVLDRDYCFRRYNPTWTDFSRRYAPPSAVPLAPGVCYFDHLPGTEPTVLPLFERVLDGETVRRNGVRLESEGIVTYWDVVLSPLVEDGEVVGILNVTVDATEREETLEALRQREADFRSRELSTLLQVSHDINSTLELRPLLNLILDQLKTVVDYSGASILTLETGEELAVRAYRGPIPREEALHLRFPLAEALVNRQVIERREPIVIPDVWEDTALAHTFRQTAGSELESTFGYVRSWLGVPLMVKGQVLGMLTLDHSQAAYFTAQHADLVMTFANQVAVAIENARLYQAEQDRQRELQTLLDVTAAASSSLDLDEMLAATLDRLVTLVGASRAGVMLLNSQSGELEPRMLRPPQVISEEDLAEMTAGCTMVLDSAQPFYIAPDESRGFAEPGALLPLLARGQRLGVLAIIGAPGKVFGEQQRALFESIADQLGMALENARLYEQAEQTAVAAERNRLARDLHDAVTQTLFSASLIAEVLPRIWERDPEEGQRRLEELRELTRGALAEMRTLLLELRPAALEEANLGDLLRQLAESITGRARVPVVLEVEGECPLEAEAKVALYRIAQEALNNVAKHAGASQAVVRFRCQPRRVELCICDDGRGFDPADMPPDSLGLGIMRERAEAIGATLTVDSQPGAGTEITVLWRSTDS